MFCHAGKPTLPFNVFVCIGLMLGAAFGLSACKPGPQALRFETIDRDNDVAGLPYESSKPGLIVVAQPQEVDSLTGLINENARVNLQTLDYSDYFALLVLQGRKPSGGYKTNITRVTRSENTVTINVEFMEPRPDEEKIAVETFPYQLIQVRKIGTWGQEITFNLIMGQARVVSVSRFIP